MELEGWGGGEALGGDGRVTMIRMKLLHQQNNTSMVNVKPSMVKGEDTEMKRVL